jgi:hypothetical protein
MTAKGVLFDFSGTLLRVEPAVRWLRAALEETGIRMPLEESADLARRLETAGALPGGTPPQSVPERLRRLCVGVPPRRAAPRGMVNRVHRVPPSRTYHRSTGRCSPTARHVTPLRRTSGTSSTGGRRPCCGQDPSTTS